MTSSQRGFSWTDRFTVSLFHPDSAALHRGRLLYFLTVVVFLLGFTSVAQAQTTTFILVRHAEKAADGSKDPDLTDAGVARSRRLVEALANQKVDAIYSTPYKRTRNTVTPLAQAKGLVVTEYEPNKKEVMDKILADHKGGTVLVVGHSNTIPWTANYLLGKNEVSDFADDQYGNLLIVTVVKIADANLVRLTY